MPLMGIPSISELIIIFGVVFLLFGAKKLPELGGAIGESIKNFKKGIKENEGDPAEAKRRELALLEAQIQEKAQAHLQAQTLAQSNPAKPVEVIIDTTKN